MPETPASDVGKIPGYTVGSALIVAALTAVASTAGLLYPHDFYPTEALRQFALANDVANLVIGVPILLGSIWLDHKGHFVGRLLWPGALMYAFYNYLAYAIAVPLNWVYPAYLLVAALSLYALAAVIGEIPMGYAQQHLAGKVPERLSGAVLLLLGGFVLIRVFFVVFSAQYGAEAIEPTELSVLLADTLLAPAWVIGGILLWRKEPLGYATGLALLFQGSMLFLGLILVLALQPVFTGARLPLVDIIVVAAMGMICFIPFVSFLRGTAAADPSG